MENLTDLKNLLARALGDSAFRARLLRDPIQAARSIGAELTEAQSAAVEQLRDDIRSQAEKVSTVGAVIRARVVVNPILLPLSRPRAAQFVPA